MRRSRPPLLLLAAALLIAAAVVLLARDGSGGHRASAGAVRRPPVVLIVFDEFPVDALRGPDGRIDAARFPHFAALARTSTWFLNTYTVHDETPYAVPAVMDGRFPKHGRPATVAGHPHSIFTLLGDRGYRVFSNEEATDICPNRLCPGAARRRKGILDNLADGRRRRFNRWLHSIRRRRQPAFYFKHSLVPHHPWIYLPSGKEVRVTLAHLMSPRGFHDPGLTAHNEERFLLQVGFVDRQIGRLMGRLRRQGLFDRALVVITADHGMSFDVGVKDRRQATRRNLDEILPVPFFLKAPGQKSARLERGYVRTVDIVPTMAAALGLRLDWRADGRSRLRGAGAARTVTLRKRFFNGVLRVRPRALEAQRVANIRRRVRMYNSGSQSSLLFGSPWTSVYRQSPRPDLIGLSLSRLSVRPAPLAALFSGTERWLSVHPRRTIPTQVAGSIPGGHGAGRRVVAVAVNGRIQAVARTFRMRGYRTEIFSMMLPESSLRRGRNLVELLEVGQGRTPRMLLLARSS